MQKIQGSRPLAISVKNTASQSPVERAVLQVALASELGTEDLTLGKQLTLSLKPGDKRNNGWEQWHFAALGADEKITFPS